MATVPVSTQRKIVELAGKGLSNRAIGLKLNLHNTTVMRYRQSGVHEPVTDPVDVDAEIRKHLRRAPVTVADLAGMMGITAGTVKRTIGQMKERGV